MCGSDRATTSASDPSSRSTHPSPPPAAYSRPPNITEAHVFFERFGRRPNLRVAATATRREFRTWRDGRPFWAGLFTFAAGLPIIYFPYAHLKFGAIPLALSTSAGAGSLIIGVLLVALAISSGSTSRRACSQGSRSFCSPSSRFPSPISGASSSG